jgi:hypothetical protein
MLANSKYISKVTLDTIDLKGAPSAQGQDADKDKEKVSKLAIKTAQRRIK